MIRSIILGLCCILLCQALVAQSRYNANWCFGQGAGLHFNADGTLDTFQVRLENFEANASISDRQGNLLFYIDVPLSNSLWGNLQPGPGVNLIAGDSLLVAGTSTNGGMFLPGADDNTFYYYHLGYNPDSAAMGNNTSLALYATTIQKDIGGPWRVTEKNKLLVTGALEEKLAVTKSADNQCWWLVTHRFSSSWCNNQFIALQVCNGTVTDSLSFNEGKPHCYGEGIAGEMLFSPDGHLLAQTVYNDSLIEIFKFDRCTGEISLFIAEDDVYNRGKLYGMAFSSDGEMLYISESPGGSDTSFLYQYWVYASYQTILYNYNNRNESVGQLEIGPDGKIYLAHCGAGCNPGITSSTTQCLGVIHNPTAPGLACDFRPYDLCFPDSVKMAFGLPNYPNYDQLPKGVYGLSAGPDTFICHNINSSVRIGTSPRFNIAYRWEADSTLSDTTIPQPIASPTLDTWYYLTMTDTTAIECAVSYDSLLVQVVVCGGIEESVESTVRLYPNPAVGELTISLTPYHQHATIELFSLLGESVLQYQLNIEHTSLDITHLAKGVYLYRIQNNGRVHTGKLLVE